jgi:putative inorganic carbon (HCO3(-)) transporter
LEKVLAFYLIVCAVTAAVGLVPTKAFIQLASFWHVSIYWLVVNTVSDRKELKAIISIVLMAATLNAAYGIVQNSLDESVRAVGSFSHPMTFAGQIQLVLLLGIAVWLQLPWGRERWAMGLLLLVLSGGLVTSYTRSAWIGFLTGGSGIGLMRGIRTGLALLAVIVLFMMIAVILQSSLGQRIQSIPDIRSTGSNEERIRIWGATLEMIRDHPIFGVGGGGYRTALEAYRERWNLRSRSHAHNNFLQQAATHGLFGLAAFAAIWVVILKTAWQAARGGLPAPYQGWLAGSAMAVVAFLVAGLFEANFGDSEVAMMMWFMVGLVMWVRMRVMPPPSVRLEGF